MRHFRRHIAGILPLASLLIPGGRCDASTSTATPPVQIIEEPVAETEKSSPARKCPLPFGLDFWRKERDRLVDHGQTFSFDYTGEFVAVQKNSVDRRKQAYLDNLNLKWTVDLQKAGLGSGRHVLSFPSWE